jgi:hypothetical protein
MPLHRSITARHGSLVLGYKGPAPVALAPRALNTPPPPGGYPLHYRAKKESQERKKEGNGRKRKEPPTKHLRSR